MAKETNTIDIKAYLEKHGKKETKVKFNERKAVVILVDTEFYRKDDIIEPHITFADELIELKIAKKYEPKEEK